MKNFIAWMFFCSVFVSLDLVASRQRDRVVPYGGLAIIGTRVRVKAGGERRPSCPSTPVLVRSAYKVLEQRISNQAGRLGEMAIAGSVVQSQLEALEDTLAAERRQRLAHEKSQEQLRFEQNDLRDKIDTLQGLFASECRDWRGGVVRGEEERRSLALEYEALRDRVARVGERSENLVRKNVFLARKVKSQAADIEELKGQVSDSRGLVGTLSASLAVNARDCDGIRNYLDALAKRDTKRSKKIDEWSSDVVESQNELNVWADGVDGKLEEKNREVGILNGRVDALEKLLQQQAK